MGYLKADRQRKSPISIVLHDFTGCSCVCIYIYKYCLKVNMAGPLQVGLVVSVSVSHAVGHRFEPWPGHTKDHHQKWYKLPPCLAHMR